MAKQYYPAQLIEFIQFDELAINGVLIDSLECRQNVWTIRALEKATMGVDNEHDGFNDVPTCWKIKDEPLQFDANGKCNMKDINGVSFTLDLIQF